MTVPLNLGIRAHDLGPTDMDNLLKKLNDYELNHIQLAVKKSFPEVFDSFDKLTPGIANYYSKRFAEAGVKISILGSYVNIVDPDLEKRKQALNDFTKHLSLADDFKASMVATETGSVGNGYTEENFTEEAFLEVIDSVRLMVKDAEKFGTTVAIEPGINHPLYTAKLAKRLIEAVDSPNLKLILDCANLMLPENHHHQAEVIEEAFELLGDHIIAMHVKDYVIEDGKVKIVPVGTGEMAYDRIMSFAKYEKPYLFVSLEATREPELENSIKLLKEVYDRV